MGINSHPAAISKETGQSGFSYRILEPCDALTGVAVPVGVGVIVGVAEGVRVRVIVAEGVEVGAGRVADGVSKGGVADGMAVNAVRACSPLQAVSKAAMRPRRQKPLREMSRPDINPALGAQAYEPRLRSIFSETGRAP